MYMCIYRYNTICLCICRICIHTLLPLFIFLVVFMLFYVARHEDPAAHGCRRRRAGAPGRRHGRRGP